MNMRDALIWLNSIGGMGGVRTRAVQDHFGSAEGILSADETALSRVKGIGAKLARAIRASDPETFLAQEYAAAGDAGVHIITTEDTDYPAPLRAIFDPPSVLYTRGTWEARDLIAVGVVGSRRCSAYGRRQAGRISRGLALAGVTVISGCARGIDGAAHDAALKAGGRTIGVLGSGLLKPYPAEHADLMQRIAAQGVLVSEFHLNQGVDRGNFVRRNRVISGLSLGVVVVEAAQRSGALITARYAAEQGRDVFAVPGNVEAPQTRGPHALIRDGARLVTDARDILEELGEAGSLLEAEEQVEAGPALKGDEGRVLDLIEHEPVHIESLISASGLKPGRVSSLLIMLEMKNLVRELPGKNYVRA